MRQHGTIFREVDRVWKRLMAQVNSDPSTEAIWNIDTLTETLVESNTKLEEV